MHFLSLLSTHLLLVFFVTRTYLFRFGTSQFFVFAVCIPSYFFIDAGIYKLFYVLVAWYTYLYTRIFYDVVLFINKDIFKNIFRLHNFINLKKFRQSMYINTINGKSDIINNEVYKNKTIIETGTNLILLSKAKYDMLELIEENKKTMSCYETNNNSWISPRLTKIEKIHISEKAINEYLKNGLKQTSNDIKENINIKIHYFEGIDNLHLLEGVYEIINKSRLVAKAIKNGHLKYGSTYLDMNKNIKNKLKKTFMN